MRIKQHFFEHFCNEYHQSFFNEADETFTGTTNSKETNSQKHYCRHTLKTMVVKSFNVENN